MKKILTFTAMTAALLIGAAEPENAVLRRRIDELSGKLAQKENELRRLRLWLAQITASGKIESATEREQQLFNALQELSRTASELAVAGNAFCDEMRPQLAQLDLASAQRVKLTFALENLERIALRVNAAADLALQKPETALKNCRVIALRNDLDFAVLSIGSLHGIFPGMNFETPDHRIMVRIAETRPFVSGAIAVKGNLRELTLNSKLVPVLVKK